MHKLLLTQSFYDSNSYLGKIRSQHSLINHFLFLNNTIEFHEAKLKRDKK